MKRYTCALCGGTYEKGWSDEEAMDEYKSVFGAGDEPPALVCDDCFKMMVPPNEKLTDTGGAGQ